jgi:hypothetical protein
LWLVTVHEDEARDGRKRKGAQPGSKGKKQGATVLSDEVRGFLSLPLLRFIDLGEPHSPNHASCALTAGGCICH